MTVWGPMERLAEEMDFLALASAPAAKAARRRGGSRTGRKRIVTG
jgi:hypothetical protein